MFLNNIILENKTLRMEFDRNNGALIGLTAVRTGWEILNRSHLGLSFQLLVPLPGKRNNVMHGEKQKVSTVEVGKDNKSLVFI
jgi:hypothetical protein